MFQSPPSPNLSNPPSHTFKLHIFQPFSFEAGNLPHIHHQEKLCDVNTLDKVQSASVVDVVYVQSMPHMIPPPTAVAVGICLDPISGTKL